MDTLISRSLLEQIESIDTIHLYRTWTTFYCKQFFYAVSGGVYIVLKHSSHLFFALESFKIHMSFGCWQFGIVVFWFLGRPCFSWDGIWQAHETAREGQDRHPQAALVKKKREAEGLMVAVGYRTDGKRSSDVNFWFGQDNFYPRKTNMTPKKRKIPNLGNHHLLESKSWFPPGGGW